MILLIGATGFLGRHTFKSLLNKEEQVACLIRKRGSIAPLKKIADCMGKEAEFIPSNLLSEDSVYSSLKNIDKAVYLVRLEYCDLLENFLAAAKRKGLKRALFVSSTTVLVPADTEIKKAKIRSEEMIKKSGLDYTILRPSMIYGDIDDGNFSKMISFIKKRSFFITFGSGKNLIQPVYVSDVSEAVAECIDNKNTYYNTYELSGKEPLSYGQMLNIVRDKMNSKFRTIKLPIGASEVALKFLSRIIKKPVLAPDQVDRMRYDKTYSHKEAKKDFNYDPISFDEGIEKLIIKMKK